MADLEALIRLRKHTVDEKQKVLGSIYAQVETIETRKKAMLNQLESERKAMAENLDLETRSYFGNFQNVVRGNIEKMNNELSHLETRLRAAQEDVRLAFAEQKRIEIVHERRQAEEAEALKQKESRELDEIGIEVFRRQDDG